MIDAFGLERTRMPYSVFVWEVMIITRKIIKGEGSL
jgi:hypothetical protein